MAHDYYLRRGHLVERIGNIFVDTMLMHLIRHHSSSQQDQDDILSFCSNSVQHNQLGILLKHMGTYQPIMADKITVDQVSLVPIPVLSAEIELKNIHLQWSKRGFHLFDQPLPLTLAEQIEGKELSSLIEHPYLPRDAIIEKLTISGQVTQVILAANRR